MSDTSETTEAPRGYRERDDFKPDPSAQYGIFDTSGTGGGTPRIEDASPIFEYAKAKDLEVAARALDPNDDSVHESLVVLPVTTDAEARQQAAQRVQAAAAASPAPEDIDLSSARLTPSNEGLAQEGGTTGGDDADGGDGSGSPATDEGGADQDRTYIDGVVGGTAPEVVEPPEA